MVHNLEGSRKFLYTCVCIGNLVAFSSGILMGWSSPVNEKLTNEHRIDENPIGVVITSDQASWIASFISLGGSLGPIFAGFLSTKIGRKKTLLFCSGAPFFASYIMICFSKTVILYYIARFIGGFGFVTMLSVLPNFFSEISEDSIRGMVTSSMNVFLMCGILYAYVVGPYLSIMWFNVSCAIWPALFLLLFWCFVPESPYYFVACDDQASAIQSLIKFRSTSEPNVMKEIEIIKRTVKQDNENIGSFKDVFKSKESVKALVIMISLMSLQQLSGINIVLFNAQTIFGATESDLAPEICTMIIGAIQFAASFVTPLAVDGLGRKFLFLVSAAGMFIAEVPLGLYFYMKGVGKDVSSISWLPMLCLIVYITFYNFGFGIVPWTVMGEIFPANIKAHASTITACYCALLAFAVLKSFPIINAIFGMGGAFWLFSAFCASGIPFVIFYMIETKGKSFEEIQNMLSCKK